MNITIYRDNIDSYQISLNLLKTMQKRGIITGSDINKASQILRKKYSIKISSLYA